MSISTAQSSTDLPQKWVTPARILWAVLVTACISMFSVTMVSMVTQPGSFEGIVIEGMGIEPSQYHAAIEEIGVSTGAFMTYVLVVVIAIALSCLALAAILVRRRSKDWLVLLLSLSYVAYGMGYIYISPFPTTNYWPAPFDILARFLTLYCGVILYLTFWFLFPDGRFRPLWSRWAGLFVLLFGLYFLIDFEDNPFYSQAIGIKPPGFLLISAIILSVIAVQVYRYLNVSTLTARQQTKWAVAGSGIALIGNMVVNLPRLLEVSWIQSSRSNLTYSVGVFTVSAILVLVGLSALVIAILRYRLWDIDLVIRRTLQYALLTGLLALAFFVGVAILQRVFGFFTGRTDSPLVTVLTTLGIAALFNPLRHRVQEFIDRRFYRPKYDARRALSRFSAAAREEVDLERLSGELVDIVEETIKPERVGLWLRPLKEDV